MDDGAHTDRTINVARQMTPEALAQAIINDYLVRSEHKLLKPTFVRNRYFQYVSLLNWSKIRVLRLRKILFDFIRKTLISHDFSVHRAPTFSMNEFFVLAKELWCQTKPKYKGSLVNRRRAPTMIMWCAATGSRWADSLVLRWEDMKIIEKKRKIFIIFSLRVSKCNAKADRDDLRTVASVDSNFWHCPVRILLEYWKFRGNPLSGFVFAHHTSMAKPVTSRAAFYHVIRAARRLNWSRLPTKHSPRVSLVKLMAKFGFSEQDINHHFGWVSDSQMFWHYLGGNLVTDENSPAFRLAHAVECGIENNDNQIIHFD